MTAENFAARLAQAKLATKDDIVFDNKLKIVFLATFTKSLSLLKPTVAVFNLPIPNLSIPDYKLAKSVLMYQQLLRFSICFRRIIR